MEIKKTSTAAIAHGLKVIVHGPAGSGKTRLCATTGDLENTLILSAEAGLLSLRDYDIDCIEVDNFAKLREAFSYLKTGDHKYTWVCLDSLSEIAEVCLSAEKAKTTDGRKAYAELADVMFNLIRGFRNLPMNVYMSAKQARIENDGSLVYSPLMPGRQLGMGLPYLFDEVFAMRVAKNDEGKIVRYLQTANDGYYDAKDRSGALDLMEKASLSYVQDKITNGKSAN